MATKKFVLVKIFILMLGILILGSYSITAQAEVDLSLVASFIGGNGIDSSGYSVSSAGDVNGDGLDDFLIGVDRVHETAEVYLILGRQEADWGTGFDLSQADAVFTGEGGNFADWGGLFPSSAGDVNGDGLDDILIGAEFNDATGPDSGKVFLILGRQEADWGTSFDLSQADAGFIRGAYTPFAHIGCIVSSAGDVNGDGLDDFLIGTGAQVWSDWAFLILGRQEADWGPSFDLLQADAVFTENGPYGNAGYPVSSAGDVNGDGLDDFLIGIGGPTTYLILGRQEADWGYYFNLSQADAGFIGEGSINVFSRWVSCAGDVNGDGLDDFLIGSLYNDEGGNNAGKTYLILGRQEADWGISFGLSQADAGFVGESADDLAGFSVSSAGDINSDGLDEILIGAPHNDEGGTYAGKTYVILGRQNADWGISFGLSQADAGFVGENVLDFSGMSVSSAGDVNGDGLDEILIGAPHNDEGGTGAGKTYLFSICSICEISVTLEPYQEFVPRGGTLDFAAHYYNPIGSSTTIEIDLEVYSPYQPFVPGGELVYNLTLEPGMNDAYYAVKIPNNAPEESGYLVKLKVISPPGSGEVEGEDSFIFTVKPEALIIDFVILPPPPPPPPPQHLENIE